MYICCMKAADNSDVLGEYTFSDDCTYRVYEDNTGLKLQCLNCKTKNRPVPTTGAYIRKLISFHLIKKNECESEQHND